MVQREKRKYSLMNWSAEFIAVILAYKAEIVLIGLGFFLIPGFLCANVLLEFIVHEKFWSLQMFCPAHVYKSVLCVSICVSLCIFVWIYTYFLRFSPFFSELNVYVYMFVFVGLCVKFYSLSLSLSLSLCMCVCLGNLVLSNGGLNLCMKFFSFIWSNELSVW